MLVLCKWSQNDIGCKGRSITWEPEKLSDLIASHCLSLPRITSHRLCSENFNYLLKMNRMWAESDPRNTLFTIRGPTHQVCSLKLQALVCFRMRTEWASKPNLLKFSWPGGLMILPFPLQRKLQLSSQDEQHVGWNRSHALSSSSRGFLLQKQKLNFSEEGISQPEEQLRTSFKSSLQADGRKSNSQHQIQV